MRIKRKILFLILTEKTKKKQTVNNKTLMLYFIGHILVHKAD